MTDQTISLAAPAASVPKRQIHWGAIGLGLILIVYAAFLLRRFEPAINEPDANGYWAQGTLLVNTGQSWFKPASDAQFIGMHWLLAPDGKYVSRYPPGLPLLIGAVYAIFGYKAAVLVNPALAIASLVGFYLLLRKLFPVLWGLMGVLVLAFNPTFITHSLANDSHMAVTFCVVWGIYLLLNWSDLPRWWTIFLAGLIFGCIPSIRYPDAVMGGAVLVFIAMHWRRPWFPLHLTLAALGAAIPIVLLMVRNQEVLGAWWRTGYALTNEQTGFGWGYFREHWLQYIDSLNASGVGLLFGLGLAAMTSMLFVPRWRALGWMLSLMCLPMVLLYMAYYWGGGGGMTLRFLLPIIPCFIIAGLWLLNEMTKHAPRGARVAVPLVVLLLQLSWAAAESGPGMSSEQSKEVLATVTNALSDVTTPGDVIVSQNQVLQHLDFVGKWKLADASLVGFGMGGGPGGGPMGGPGRGGRFGGPGGGVGGPGGGFAGPGRRGGRGFGPPGMGPDDLAADAPSPMQMEKNRAQRELYQGFDGQQRFAKDVFTWAGDRSVWLIGPEQEIEEEAQTLYPDSRLEVIRRVQLPEQAQLEEPMMGRGGRGPGGPGMGGRGGRGGPMGGPGGGFAGPGMRGGRGGRAGPGGPGGGGGPMGAAFMGETEVVIAKWTAPAIPPAQ